MIGSKKIICLMGPTACGKTDLAIQLTQKIPADIISVDSALVYRGMDIGTGKPTAAELKIAPHRLINLCDPAVSYSAGQFCADAVREINSILSCDRVPLLVGGTMLYFHKLLFGLAELPTANKKIKPQDPQRISRALEVFMLTGKAISTLQKNNQSPLLNSSDVISIALI